VKYGPDQRTVIKSNPGYRWRKEQGPGHRNITPGTGAGTNMDPATGI